MRYEEYEKKIIKRAKVRKAIYRFRWPIIIVSTVGILTAGALIGTKGIVSEKQRLAKTYTYGDTLSYLSTAFMSTASYEFAELDSEEWSDEVPYLVGDYKMRSRGLNSFKSYYYGDVQEFNIEPKEVVATVLQDNMTYGDQPILKLEGLCYDDHFDNTYTMQLENRGQAKWTITPNSDSIKIFAKDGKDVTNNYKIVEQSKVVDILKRSLTISTGSSSKKYDGTPLKNEEFNIISGSLVEGDEILLVSSNDITNYGSVSNEHTYQIKSSDDLDMSIHYAINEQKGTLNITKRNLTVSSPNKEFTYDGLDKKFSLDDVYISSGDGLASGEEIVYEYANDNSFVYAGQYSNSFKAKVVNGNIDVSNNYAIQYDFGSTVIKKRDIEIKSDSDTFTYNKQSRKVDTATILSGSLADKDKLVIDTYPQYTDSGIYDNELTFSILDKATNADMISNYNVNYSSGKITINKVDLTISLVKQEVVYDGMPHQNTYVISEGSLVEDDEICVITNPEMTDVGVYDNTDFEATIKDENGLENIKNYNFECVNREEAMTITKRPLTITSLSKSKLYDAKKISETLGEDEVLYEINDGTLADDEYISFAYLNDPKDAGEYAIQKEFAIYHQVGKEKDKDNDLDVTSNYDITFNDGTFNISKRSITIQTLDFEHVYNRSKNIDSSAQTFEVLDTGDGLVDGHKVTNLVLTCDGINVGSYDYNIDESSLVIKDKNKNVVTNNYEVTYIKTGKVTITKRPVSVKLNEGSRIYDGTPFTYGACTAINLLSGDYFEFEGLPSITHVWEGPVTNTPSSMTIHMSDGTDVTGNYEITELTHDSIEIRQRPIRVESNSIKKTFDGTPINKSSAYKITSGSLAAGDRIVVDYMASNDNTFIHAGEYENTFSISIYNSNNLDVTADYDISLVCGYITIDTCKISLGLFNNAIIYNGMSHSMTISENNVTSATSNVYITDGHLPNGCELSFSIDYTNCKYPFDEYNYFSFQYHVTCLGEVEAYDSDFEVTIGSHGLSIVRRNITLQTCGGDKIYDGAPFGAELSDEDYLWIATGSLAPGDYIAGFTRSSIIEACENELNTISDLVIKNSEGMDVTAYYNLTVIPGRVTIYEM